VLPNIHLNYLLAYSVIRTTGAAESQSGPDDGARARWDLISMLQFVLGR
jgi:hypothetical protein